MRRRFSTKRRNYFASRLRSVCRWIVIKENPFVLYLLILWAFLTLSSVLFGQLLLVLWAMNSLTWFKKLKPDKTTLIPKSTERCLLSVAIGLSGLLCLLEGAQIGSFSLGFPQHIHTSSEVVIRWKNTFLYIYRADFWKWFWVFLLLLSKFMLHPSPNFKNLSHCFGTSCNGWLVNIQLFCEHFQRLPSSSSRNAYKFVVFKLFQFSSAFFVPHIKTITFKSIEPFIALSATKIMLAVSLHQPSMWFQRQFFRWNEKIICLCISRFLGAESYI